MANVKSLLKDWALPDRSLDRSQITLRLPYGDYARLHALKEAFPNRSVNDLICDLIKSGLDEVIEALPSWKIDFEEASEMACHFGGTPDEYKDEMTGPRVTFDIAYRRLMQERKGEDAASDLRAVS